MKERVAYGLYGLYPKYKLYLESFSILLMLVSHALIASILQQDRGSLGDKCESLFLHTPPLQKIMQKKINVTK